MKILLKLIIVVFCLFANLACERNIDITNDDSEKMVAITSDIAKIKNTMQYPMFKTGKLYDNIMSVQSSETRQHLLDMLIDATLNPNLNAAPMAAREGMLNDQWEKCLIVFEMMRKYGIQDLIAWEYVTSVLDKQLAEINFVDTIIKEGKLSQREIYHYASYVRRLRLMYCGSVSFVKEVILPRVKLPAEEYNSFKIRNEFVKALDIVKNGDSELTPVLDKKEMLKNIAAMTNTEERVLQTKSLYQKYYKSPQDTLEEFKSLPRINWERYYFLSECIDSLHKGNVNMQSISAGWEMQSRHLDDLEEMIRLTEDAFNTKLSRACTWWTQEQMNEWRRTRHEYDVSVMVRQLYERYFKYTFWSAINGSYFALSSAEREKFVAQIKRDFFHRPGMKYVPFDKLPADFNIAKLNQTK